MLGAWYEVLPNSFPFHLPVYQFSNLPSPWRDNVLCSSPLRVFSCVIMSAAIDVSPSRADLKLIDGWVFVFCDNDEFFQQHLTGSYPQTPQIPQIPQTSRSDLDTINGMFIANYWGQSLAISAPSATTPGLYVLQSCRRTGDLMTFCRRVKNVSSPLTRVTLGSSPDYCNSYTMDGFNLVLRAWESLNIAWC